MGSARWTGRCNDAIARFLTPEAYPHCLSVGQRLEVFEGSRHVGELEIIEVANPVLVAR